MASPSTDRSVVSLCLELAVKLASAPGVTTAQLGASMTDAALHSADKLLKWHDARTTERAKQDPLRSPQVAVDMPA